VFVKSFDNFSYGIIRHLEDKMPIPGVSVALCSL